MVKNRILVKAFLLMILGLFSFSSISYADEWNDDEFQKLVLEEKIEVYGLDELKNAGILESDAINKVTYTAFFEDGVSYDINLQVTTNTSGAITAVVSDASTSTFEALKRRGKPKKGKNNTVPYKLNGGMNKSSFINEHAYDRHKYNPKKKSTPNDTQYGRNVDVKKLREETMNNYDNKWSQTDKKGNTQVFYAKRFDSNISTSDTSTRDHRVIINISNSAKSTQFPLAF